MADFKKIDERHENCVGEIDAAFTAAIITQARKNGIKVHCVDSRLGAGQEMPLGLDWYKKYDALKEELKRDYFRPNPVSAMNSTQWDEMNEFLLSHQNDYSELVAMRNKKFEWMKTRIGHANYDMAKTIVQRTKGEKFAVFVGSAHLYGKHSLSSLVKPISPDESITVDIFSEESHRRNAYGSLGCKGIRYFDCEDFTFPPNISLVLDGQSIILPNPETVKRAQQITLDGAYDVYPCAMPTILPSEIFRRGSVRG